MERTSLATLHEAARRAVLDSPARIGSVLTRREARAFFSGDYEMAARLAVDAPLDARSLETQNPEILVTCWSTPPLPEPWLRSSECRLRYVCHLTGSVRHFLPREFIERGGRVTNWGRLPADAVAEHALLLALSALRRAPAWRATFSDTAEAPERMQLLGARTLKGRRVGVHGFGAAAQALVRLLQPFSCPISAFSAGVPEALYAEFGVRRAASLRELYASSEVLFICEALTPATERSVGAAELALLEEDAVLVNIARGRLIDEPALLDQARRGRLRVALDVFSEEPLPPDSPWFELRNVVISPHIAGPTSDQYPLLGNLAVENLARYLTGEPLRHLVTTAVYDRTT